MTGALALAVTVSARQAAVASPPARAHLAGVVVRDRRAKTPVSDALVLVAGVDVSTTRVVATDGHGRFDCPNLEPGRYLIAAAKPGFMETTYGAHAAARDGDVLTLSAGEFQRDLSIVLQPAASLSGTITDDAGAPVVGARVRVLPRRTVGDEIALAGDAGAPTAPVTDDLGDYRVYDLPAGDYVVLAQSRGFGPGDTALPDAPTAGPAAVAGASIGTAPVFWPDAADVARATTISLAAGDDREHIDFRVPIVRLARIDGTIRGRPVGPTDVQLRPPDWRTSGVTRIAQNARADATGHFAFTNVPPGEYSVSARSVAAPPPDIIAPPGELQPAEWALTHVSVQGADTVIGLDLEQPLGISGHAIFAGLGRPPSDITVRIGLRATPASLAPRLPAPAAVEADGQFHLDGVLPGRYWIVASIPTDPVTQFPDWIAGSATIGGVDAFDAPVAITRDVAGGDLAVTFTRTTQQIDGRVVDAHGTPVADCPVLVFATDPLGWFPQSRRISLRRTDSAGALLFNVGAALPPGEYFVAAAPDIRPADEFDPAFLKELSRTATRVSLQPGDSRTVSLRVPSDR